MINYTNPKYSGSPLIPLPVGDRHYGQDLTRDIRYHQDQRGVLSKRIFGGEKVIIEGMLVTQGVGHTLNITAGNAVGKFNVVIPHKTNAWALPPDTETDDIFVIIPIPTDITGLAITGANTDNVTTNYVKLAYNENDGNTRNRAKKAGSYAYEVQPYYTITVNDTAPTTYEVVLETFITNGTTITFQGNESPRVDVDLQTIETYTNITANQIISPNRKYKTTNAIDLTLPEANEGDKIDIFVEDYAKVLQSDANHVISYKNKYFTAKGANGYLELPSKSTLRLIYKGSGDSRIEPGVKLSNPATLPPFDGLDCSFSHNDVYLAVSHGSSPYITIYKRSGDTFTKLADPATLPTGTGESCAFSYDDVYLAVGHSTTPFITIYKRSGDTFTKLANPSTLPANVGWGCAFSFDTTYLAVAHPNSPYITIYKRSGDVFTKLTNPSSLPTGNAYYCAFSYDGRFLAVAHTSSPYITIYKRSGDTFTKLANPSTLPASTAFGCTFSYDGRFLAVAHTGSPFITIYRIDGDTFTKIADPATLPSGPGAIHFSYDGRYLAVGDAVTPFVIVYKIDGETFIKLSDPSTLPAGNTKQVQFNYDGRYLATTHFNSPYVTIYKNVESVTKAWLLEKINTLYEQDLEYVFK